MEFHKEGVVTVNEGEVYGDDETLGLAQPCSDFNKVTLEQTRKCDC
jgi:hypothetical protein